MCYTKKFRTAKEVMALDFAYYMYLASGRGWTFCKPKTEHNAGRS